MKHLKTILSIAKNPVAFVACGFFTAFRMTEPPLTGFHLCGNNGKNEKREKGRDYFPELSTQ